MQCFQKQISNGGYSSGYYSYKWAEVLDADAFAYFQEKGIFDKETAKSFKDNVLSKGGTELPMELYKKFRGQEPKVDALLKRAGLVQIFNFLNKKPVKIKLNGFLYKILKIYLVDCIDIKHKTFYCCWWVCTIINL